MLTELYDPFFRQIFDLFQLMCSDILHCISLSSAEDSGEMKKRKHMGFKYCYFYCDTHWEPLHRKDYKIILYPLIILSRFPLVMFHYIADLGHVIGKLLLHVP